MGDFVYWISRLIGVALLPLFIRLHRLGFANVPPGPYLLLCNHISHFDPPLLVVAMTRRIDYMTMLELFQNKIFSIWLKTVGAFPINHKIKDIQSVRTAVQRLKMGHIVGIFPEGGIRLGHESILGGASLSISAATLAQLGGSPIRTCLIMGSDQLYDWKAWFRRPDVYLIFGDELHSDLSLSKTESRQKLTREVENSFHLLYQRLQTEYRISAEVLPRTAQERWALR